MRSIALSPALSTVMRRARACTACKAALPHEPRPVFRAAPSARLLIVGQAPGRRVHETGVPWNDPSGNVLREWLQLEREAFYDVSSVAIVPMGLCYPGTVEGADLPPRTECGPRWQPAFRAALPQVRLTLLIGQYAAAFHLQQRRKRTLTETVRAFREYLPEYFVLPHPSWRNKAWLKKNPWFAELVLPALRNRVKACLRTV